MLLRSRLPVIVIQRKKFIIGFLTLTVASITTGLAPSGIVLIIANVLQGIGAALIAPSPLSMVVSLFAYNILKMNKAVDMYYELKTGRSKKLPF